MIPELLTLDELAALLKLKPRTVRRHHDAGTIPPAIRIGSTLRWNRAAIEAWIAQGGKPVRRGPR